jgi:hypothetical protein
VNGHIARTPNRFTKLVLLRQTTAIVNATRLPDVAHPPAFFTPPTKLNFAHNDDDS